MFPSARYAIAREGNTISEDQVVVSPALFGHLFYVSGADGAFSTLMTVLAGAVMAVLGGVVATGPQPYSGGEVASAEVVAVEQDRSGWRARYLPVVEFAVDGTVYRVTAQRGEAFAPSVGSTVKVSFPPGRPDQARSLHQPRSTTVLAGAVVVGGTLTVGAGVIVWRRRLNTARAVSAPTSA